MKRLIPLALLLGSCGASHHAEPPVSGPPSTEPEVLAAVESRVPFQSAPSTTVAPTTTHAHPTTTEPVVPLTTQPPVVATTAVRSGGRLGDPYYIPTWHTLRECEAPDWAGGWQANTGNGFYGGLQFTLSSWEWVGGYGYPHQASVDEQIRRGQMLWEHQGWRAWPTCSRKLGWR